MSLREDIQRVLDVARDFSKNTTPAMSARNEALNDIAAALNDSLPTLAVSTGIDELSLSAHAGGRQSNYSPTAWVRVFDKRYSPRATEGFYIVYLFASDGSRVYLSLNQGTSEWRSGAIRPINDRSELRARATEARRLLREFETTPLMRNALIEIDLATDSVADVGRESRQRTRNYEDANVLARCYEAGAVPPAGTLFQDVDDLLPLLARLYRVPMRLDQEADAPGTTATGAGPSIAERTRSKAQGRVMDPAVRLAIEKFAEDAAIRELRTEWTTERVGHLHRGYDLECINGDRTLHVEVKGTQSAGVEVVLTRNEVHHHHEHGGNCTAEHALFILADIQVETEPTVVCSGGQGYFHMPWFPRCHDLTATEYAYRVPPLR